MTPISSRTPRRGNVQFGFPNGDSVVTAVGHGLKVDVVDTTYQQGIGALMFLTKSGIREPGRSQGEDRRGHRSRESQLSAASGDAQDRRSEPQRRQRGGDSDCEYRSGARERERRRDRVLASALLRDAERGLQRRADPEPRLPAVIRKRPDHEPVVPGNRKAVAGFIAALHESINWISQGHALGAAKFSIATAAQSFAGQEQQIADVLKQCLHPQPLALRTDVSSRSRLRKPHALAGGRQRPTVVRSDPVGDPGIRRS